MKVVLIPCGCVVETDDKKEWLKRKTCSEDLEPITETKSIELFKDFLTRLNVDHDNRYGKIKSLAENNINTAAKTFLSIAYADSSSRAKKDLDMWLEKSEIESIQDLLFRVQNALNKSYEVAERIVTFVVGSTGAGKSTFLNYMFDCKNFKLVGDTAASKHYKCENEKFRTGFSIDSVTEDPQIEHEQTLDIVFCDPPGFFDTNGPKQRLINDLTLQSIGNECKQVKCVTLMVELAGIVSARGKNLKDSLQKLEELLGPENMDSIFVMITKALDTPNQNVAQLLDDICDYQDSPKTQLKKLRDQSKIGFYNPADNHKGQPYVYDRASFAKRVKEYKGMEKKADTFKLSMEPETEQLIALCIDAAEKEVVSYFTATTLETDSKIAEIGALTGYTNKLVKLLGHMKAFKKYEAFKKAVEAQIHLVGANATSTTTLETLEEMKRVFPEDFSLTIEGVCKKLQKRLADEKENAEKMAKAEQEIAACEVNINAVKIEKEKLNEKLAKAEISEEQYKNRNKQLELTNAQYLQEQQKHKEEMDQMRRKFDQEKEELKKLSSRYQNDRSNSVQQMNDLGFFISLLRAQQPYQASPSPSPCSPFMGGFPNPFMSGNAPQYFGNQSPCGGNVFGGNNGGGGGSLGSRSIYVRPYTRANGTRVEGYYRKAPGK